MKQRFHSTTWRVLVVLAVVMTASCTTALAQRSRTTARRKIEVGPGKPFATLSQAVRTAKDGDVIEIDSGGDYAGDVCTIRANDLTLRGVGEGRAKFPAAGKNVAGKGIWVVSGNDLTVENIEFSDARVRDRNGAGIRAQGKNLTVRNCKFHNCENGILGGAGVVLIEHCEFSHCGLNGRAHNLYIARADKLIFRFNYSHHAKAGHLLKSRAKTNDIRYNYLSDESGGSSSYVVNLPNGGKCHLVGNVFCQGPQTQNSAMIAYGEEGVSNPDPQLFLINNTLVNNRRTGTFIQVRKTGATFQLVAKNNIFAGRGTLTNLKTAVLRGNFSGGDPLFVDGAGFDFRLKAGSPCIDQGIEPNKDGGPSLEPAFHYAHPHSKAKRPRVERIDIGAFEFK